MQIGRLGSMWFPNLIWNVTQSAFSVFIVEICLYHRIGCVEKTLGGSQFAHHERVIHSFLFHLYSFNIFLYYSRSLLHKQSLT